MKGKPRLNLTGPAEYVAGLPVLKEMEARADGQKLSLVGGAVRDALLGLEHTDIDLVLEGDAIELALRLDPEAVTHERFGTAEFEMEGHRVDLVTARREKYSHPGSLPEVTPATLAEDLDRRDFTINAIAVDLREPEKLIDPLDGLADLERGVLRVLHGESFRDDPTRAMRAARYAARFGFDLEPATGDLLSSVDLSTVSTERVRAELDLIAEEDEALKAMALVSQWGLLDLDPARLQLAADAIELSRAEPWRGVCERGQIVLEAVCGDPEPLAGLDGTEPATASEAVLRARRLSDCEQLLARASGHAWLDRYRSEWAGVELEIGGEDLIRAGVPQGPAIGLGLDAALAARLDRGVSGFEAELAVALAAARG